AARIPRNACAMVRPGEGPTEARARGPHEDGRPRRALRAAPRRQAPRRSGAMRASRGYAFPRRHPLLPARPRPRKIFCPLVSRVSDFSETFVSPYQRRRPMSRFIPALVRGYPPTALPVFFDGAAPAQAARAARYRRACPPARRDLLWRDLEQYPDALSL